MPDKEGLLTPAEREQVAAWLNRRAKIQTCWVCGSNSWAIGSHLISAKAHLGGYLAFGGLAYPLVFIVCQNCAHTLSFMAKDIGIGPSDDLPDGA